MAARRRSEWMAMGAGKTYLHRTHWPLQCLVFISPLLLIYQIGAILHPWQPDPAVPQDHVIAFLLMLKFFAIFGAVGSWLPLATVVAILLCWHIARQDKWDFDPSLYLGMAAESIALGLAFFVIGLAFQQHLGAATTEAMAERMKWQSAATVSIGAGVYEELLFRLIAITVLNMILVDALQLRLSQAIPLIILSSAALFASYHVLDTNTIMTPYRFFYLMAFGVYMATIFVYRGFGIAVGAHAVYDLIVVATAFGRPH